MTRILILIGILYASLSSAQRDSIQLESIEISATSLKSLSEINTVQWRPAAITTSLSTNLAAFLSQNSNVFLKNYGPNTLATSSISGGNASQTAIYWNGIPINNPMLGLLDISLLPTRSMESISLSNQANTAQWGGGNIAGAIHLNNNFHEEGIGLSSQYSSINHLTNNASLNMKTKLFRSSSKVEISQGRNNYSYELINGDKKKLQHADVRQMQVMQNIYLNEFRGNTISGHAWLTSSRRGIPPTTQQTTSVDTTLDYNQRYVLKWDKKWKSSLILQNTIGYTIDDNRYLSGLSENTTNKAKSLRASSNLSHTISPTFSYLVGIDYTNIQARTKAYKQTIIQNTYAIYGSAKIDIMRFMLQADIRQERIQDFYTPISPSLQLQYSTKHHVFSAHVNRNYRYPALNDLYWKPGGNESLLAESGWAYRLSHHYKKSIKSIIFDSEISVYSRLVDDWILWAREPNTPFFAAYNIAKVWSRGIQTSVQFNYTMSKQSLSLQAKYNYTLSTSERSIELPKLPKGQQIWYTPVHQGNVAVEYKTSVFSTKFIQQHVGSSIGLNENIPAYNISSLQSTFSPQWGKSKFVILLDINNIFNKQYRVIERRPMPGRHFIIGISLYINTNKKNK